LSSDPVTPANSKCTKCGLNAKICKTAAIPTSCLNNFNLYTISGNTICIPANKYGNTNTYATDFTYQPTSIVCTLGSATV